MADNTPLNKSGPQGVLGTISRSGVKTQIAQVDVGGSASEQLLIATAKGTQGAVGVPVQSPFDGARVISNYMSASATSPVAVAATATNALVTLMNTRGNTTVTGTTTPAIITLGTIYRITSIEISMFNSATLGTCKIALRYKSSGVLTSASDGVEVCAWIIGAPIPSNSVGWGGPHVIEIRDGMEFLGGGSIGVTLLGLGTDGSTSTAAGVVSVCINGYEY